MKQSFYLTDINIMNLDVGHCFQKGRLLNAILAGSCCKAHIKGNWTMLLLLESISPTITFLTYAGGFRNVLMVQIGKRGKVIKVLHVCFRETSSWCGLRKKDKCHKGASCLF